MSGEIPAAAAGQQEPEAQPTGPFRWLWQTENFFVALALAALMLLPLIEIVGRKLFHGGINGAAAFQQHSLPGFLPRRGSLRPLDFRLRR